MNIGNKKKGAGLPRLYLHCKILHTRVGVVANETALGIVSNVFVNSNRLVNSIVIDYLCSSLDLDGCRRASAMMSTTWFSISHRVYWCRNLDVKTFAFCFACFNCVNTSVRSNSGPDRENSQEGSENNFFHDKTPVFCQKIAR